MSHPLIIDLRDYFQAQNSETISGVYDIFDTWITANLPEQEAETKRTEYHNNIQTKLSDFLEYECNDYLSETANLLNIEK